MEKWVCINCFTDPNIRAFINHYDEGVCSYCESSAPVAPFKDLMHFLLRGISEEYGEPAEEGVAWEDSKYIGVKIYEAFELVHYELELEIVDDVLEEEIIVALSSQFWCNKDPYALRKHEEMFVEWERFSNQVKHQVRYVFFKLKTRFGKGVFDQRYLNEPHEILEYIANSCQNMNLFMDLPVGTGIYRVRVHNNDKDYTSAKELGTPPVEKAIYSNRMSPAGIPMFYGSDDEETAVAEAIVNREARGYATIGVFTTTRVLRLLDLTALPDVPSLFDDNRRDMRGALKFLHDFLADFSSPISRDGGEHIEYVPTQIVTEYFRHIFIENIDGIIYPSSRRPTRNSFVLFLESYDCGSDADTDSKQDTTLRLLTSAVRTIKLIQKNASAQ